MTMDINDMDEVKRRPTIRCTWRLIAAFYQPWLGSEGVFEWGIRG